MKWCRKIFVMPLKFYLITSFVIFMIFFCIKPTYSPTIFLYYMYAILMIGFICYPLKCYQEYYICMSLFFFGFVPLAIFFLYFEPKQSLLYFATTFIYSAGNENQLLYYLPEMFFMQSVNIFFFLLTIPLFRVLVSIAF